MTLRERFWSKTQIGSGCWLWLGCLNNLGYGNIGVGSRTDGSRRTLKAHRVAYELLVGPIPDGLCVLHRCDNPACVNPDHLFLGTLLDNSRDMVAKGRAWTGEPRIGEAHPMAKLTERKVRAIRKSYSCGDVTQKELGDRYGISQTQIGRIVRGVRWKEEGLL